MPPPAVVWKLVAFTRLACVRIVSRHLHLDEELKASLVKLYTVIDAATPAFHFLCGFTYYAS